MKQSSDIRLFPGVSSVRTRPLIAVCLTVLLLVSALAGSFHHHADLDDHPDCTICAVAHHSSAAFSAAAGAALILPTTFATRFISLQLSAASSWNPNSPQSRAPPAADLS